MRSLLVSTACILAVGMRTMSCFRLSHRRSDIICEDRVAFFMKCTGHMTCLPAVQFPDPPSISSCRERSSRCLRRSCAITVYSRPHPKEGRQPPQAHHPFWPTTCQSFVTDSTVQGVSNSCRAQSLLNRSLYLKLLSFSGVSTSAQYA